MAKSLVGAKELTSRDINKAIRDLLKVYKEVTARPMINGDFKWGAVADNHLQITIDALVKKEKEMKKEEKEKS